MPTPDNENPEVVRWFGKLDHPLKAAMMQVREIIMEADPRMEESIKWSAPTFAYGGNLASFQPRAMKFVSLMFHRGSEIPGNHPLLKGDAALVRIMRFTDLEDVANRRGDLEAIVRDWCFWRAENS
ncbi:MAG: DUF1801 domain-containing protein [Anaerolineales bacterium]